MATLKVAAAPPTPGSRNWLALVLGVLVGSCFWFALAPESGLCTMPDGKVVNLAVMLAPRPLGGGADRSVDLISGGVGGGEALGGGAPPTKRQLPGKRKLLASDGDDVQQPPSAAPAQPDASGGSRYWDHGPVEEAKIPASVPAFTLPAEIKPDEPLDAVIWYPPECEVEKHFVLKELLPGALRGGRLTIRTLYPRTTTSFRRHDDFAAINMTDTPNVVVFHGMIEDMQKCDSAIPEKVQYYKPAFTFLLSDEQGASWCGNQRLADMAPMTLRQYAPPQHPMGMRHSMLTLPLGYNGPDGFVPRSNLTVASKRSVVWAWAGAVRNDRVEMLQVLQQAFANYDAAPNKNLPRSKMIPMYLAAKFVPNARGQVSHDCFRLYEASKSGAIPVVTGPRQRIFDTFGHFVGSEGRLPPWVYVDKWADAPAVMNLLLRQPSRLDEMQRDVLDWWDRSVEATKATIRRALVVDLLYRRSIAGAVSAWRAKGGPLADAVANALEYSPRPSPATRDTELAAAPPKPPAGVRRAPSNFNNNINAVRPPRRSDP